MVRIAVVAVMVGFVVVWGGSAHAQVSVLEQVCEAGGGCATCRNDLGDCESELGGCSGDLEACAEALATCNEELAGCQHLPATGQKRMVVAGEDGNPAFGAALSYTDNGDGTITDDNTGLVWEKKIKRDGTATGDPHDADNIYPWQGVCTRPAVNAGSKAECGTDGDCVVAGETCNGFSGEPSTTIFEWLAALNAMEFAGHGDWRIPNVRELHSIVDYGRVGPAIDPAFNGTSCSGACVDDTSPACSCTGFLSFRHWAATSSAGIPNGASIVSFSDGSVGIAAKGIHNFVRAVRGGS